MAVARCAADFLTTHQSQTEDSSFSVTVPADCTSGNNGICIVVVTGWCNSTTNPLFTELNWDNGNALDFTHIISERWSDVGEFADTAISSFYMLSNDGNWPGTGVKTLYYQTVDTIYEGLNIAVFFYKGVDLVDPIVGTDSTLHIVGPWTSSIAGEGADDYGIVAAYNYTPNTSDASQSGQAVIWESGIYNDDDFAAGDELGEGELTVSSSGSDNMVAIAFVLNAAAVGGPSIIPIIHHLRRH